MKIFNVIINGADAKWFCGLSHDKKVAWIKNNTIQKSETAILEFLSMPLKDNDCGCGCGEQKNYGNISKAIPTEDTKSSEDNGTSPASERIANKRRSNVKDS